VKNKEKQGRNKEKQGKTRILVFPCFSLSGLLRVQSAGPAKAYAKPSRNRSKSILRSPTRRRG
jgi:hypothetical protein